MSWVKLDDQARHHRKILAVGPTAAWLWACGLMYCNSQKARDGFIPAEAVQILYPVPNWKREIPKLVSAGLWEEVSGGYVIHDYHEYQPTVDDAAALSEKRAAAGRLGGMRRAERQSAPPPSSKQTPKQVASVCLEANAKQNEARPDPDPDPDPGPTKEEQSPHPPKGGSTERPPREKRTRSGTVMTLWPEGFAVSPAIAKMCRDEGLPNPYDVIRDFESSARAKAYRYADWEAAFRKWMRSEITRRSYPVWDLPEEPQPALNYGPPVPPPEGFLDRFKAHTRSPSPFDREDDDDRPGADVKWTPKPKDGAA